MSLIGRVVMVTRPAARAQGMLERLRDLGAHPIAAPTISIEEAPDGGPLDRAVSEASAGRYAWVVFTSAAGVRAWMAREGALSVARPDARVAAVGDATADALRARGLEPDLVPPTFTTSSLGDAFPTGAGRVLLARADLAAEELESALRAKGWTAERVDAYSVRPADALPPAASRALAEGRVDVVTFTSPSTVEGFRRLAGVPLGPQVACIGPVTADAARRSGFEVSAVAEPHTEEGLVRALESLFG